MVFPEGVMGLFDILSKTLSVSDQKDTASSQRGGATSALSPGRMRETDVIKGKDSPLPNQPGVYRHKDKATGETEYVGQTNDLRKRQQQHARDGRLDTTRQVVAFSVAKTDASKDDLCKTEIKHIARHKPAGNSTKGGNGRR
jgi:hypothetical protein